jgi:hypothetical protein
MRRSRGLGDVYKRQIGGREVDIYEQSSSAPRTG